MSGDIKKLLSKYAGVGVYPTMNKLGKTIQLNYNYHNIYVIIDFFEDKYNVVVYHDGINANDLEKLRNATERFLGAYTFSEEPVAKKKLIKGIVTQ